MNWKGVVSLAAISAYTDSGDFDDGRLRGETLRFGIANDQPDPVSTGIQQETKGCGCLCSGVVVGPLHRDFSINRTYVLTVTIKNGRNHSQFVGVFSVGL